MTTDYFRKHVAPALPDSPGVYRFIGKNGAVLYVGKAKSLRKRVASYFNKAHSSGRVVVLTRRTKELLFTVVETEHDALLLENSFIKKHQPRYNIQLKDDKSFPFICIKNEPFPRIFLTRRRINDGSRYLGPYTSVKRMKHVLSFVRTLYPLRNCNLKLTEKNIAKRKFKVCLEYHMGNCLGPCEGLQTSTAYDHSIAQITDILKGKTSKVLAEVRKEMKGHAQRLEFEKANQAKKRIALLEDFQSTSAVVSPRIDNVDVFGLYRTPQVAYVTYFRIANGTIVTAHVSELRPRLGEPDAEVLAFAIPLLRSRFESDTTEILVPIRVDYTDPQVRLTVPGRGEKKLLVELSTRNAKEYALATQAKRQERGSPVLEGLMADLRLPALPARIECIDNSNIQGSYPVAALVVFRNGKPSKSDYRHYNIKTVAGANDFATMKEVVARRFSKGNPSDLPNLLLIDGGKGQLNAAREALQEAGLAGQIPLAGIAKKLEEIYLPGDPLPLHISKRSPSLRLMQAIRDEAHRFAVSFHRLKRNKSTLQTELTSIDGIGAATGTKLLKAFGSVKVIREATMEELSAIVGPVRATKLKAHFQSAPKAKP